MDALGFRKKIGIVVPSTNTIVGPECEDLRPRGVTNHVARLTIKQQPIQASDQGYLAHVQGMRDGIAPAIDQVTRLAEAVDDFDGQTRPAGAGEADIGADEFGEIDLSFADGFE